MHVVSECAHEMRLAAPASPLMSKVLPWLAWLGAVQESGECRPCLGVNTFHVKSVRLEDVVTVGHRVEDFERRRGAVGRHAASPADERGGANR